MELFSRSRRSSKKKSKSNYESYKQNIIEYRGLIDELPINKSDKEEIYDFITKVGSLEVDFEKNSISEDDFLREICLSQNGNVKKINVRLNNFYKKKNLTNDFITKLASCKFGMGGKSKKRRTNKKKRHTRRRKYQKKKIDPILFYFIE